MIDVVLQQAVLDRIAANHEVDPECVSVDENGGVFCLFGNRLECLCQHGGHYWGQIEAEVTTSRLIERAARH